jgi:hypothetical protein
LRIDLDQPQSLEHALFIKTQKASGYFFDLVMRQGRVWHSLRIVETPMCGHQETRQRFRIKGFLSNNVNEGPEASTWFDRADQVPRYDKPQRPQSLRSLID